VQDTDTTDRLQDLLSLLPFRPTTEYPALLTPYLYLGSSQHAKNVELLSTLHVTDVINCAESEVGTDHYTSLVAASIRCIGFDSNDRSDYQMLHHFPLVLALVQAIKQNHGVCLLHCLAGVNRSGFLAIALLCSLEGYSLLGAAAWARQQRGRVCTNTGFQRQLIVLAKERRWLLQ
jgi:protein-tyrosine phosphatase